MKRMHYLLAGLMIPAMLASCSSEDGVAETPIAPSDKNLPVVKLYANGGGSDTRTTIDNTGMVNWSGTDKISVNGRVSTSIKLTGAHTAIFEVLAVGPYTAVYPASVAEFFDPNSGNVHLNVPSVQKYIDGDSFADDVNISVAYSETEQLSFKNVCGLLKTTIKAGANSTLKNITKARLIVDKPISGLAELNPKTLELVFRAETKNYIDIVFDTAKTIDDVNGIKLVWSIVPGIYDDWTIELYDDDERHIVRTISAIKHASESPVAVRRSIISTVNPEFPPYYTIEVKAGNDNINVDDWSLGKHLMFEGEERKFRVGSTKNGYNLRDWTTDQPSFKHKYVDEKTKQDLIVTAYTDEVISQSAVYGLIIEGVVWSSAPLKRTKEFFDFQQKDPWRNLPIAGTIDCPDGWKYPTYAEQDGLKRFLEKQTSIVGEFKFYSFNFYPTDNMGGVVFNTSPKVSSVKRSTLDLTTAGVFNGSSTSEDNKSMPMRCVKALSDY